MQSDGKHHARWRCLFLAFVALSIVCSLFHTDIYFFSPQKYVSDLLSCWRKSREDLEEYRDSLLLGWEAAFRGQRTAVTLGPWPNKHSATELPRQGRVGRAKNEQTMWKMPFATISLALVITSRNCRNWVKGGGLCLQIRWRGERQRNVSGCQLTGVLLQHDSPFDPHGSAPSGNTLTMLVDSCQSLAAPACAYWGSPTSDGF